MIRAESNEYIEHALEEMEKFKKGEKEIDSNLKRSIYSAYICHGSNPNRLEQLFKQYNITKMDNDKISIKSTFGSSNSSENIEKVIQFILSDNIRSQDKATALLSLSLHGKNQRNKVLNLTIENFDHLADILDQHSLSRLLQTLIGQFRTVDDLIKIQSFFENKTFDGIQRGIQLGIEDCCQKAIIFHREKDSIEKYFKNFR